MKIVKRLIRFLTVGVLGFVVGAIAIYIQQQRSGLPLERWHTVELTAEFTAERSEEVRSFDDYRKLEDALFAQLDREVYDRVGTGPAYALVRYSTGSAADPRRRTPNWNRSFELTTDAPAGGVLLLHGMSDSPYSLQTLGQSLHRRGYWVLGLRLPGHGTAPSGLTTVHWRDMAAAVRLAMNHLAEKVGSRPVHVAGYSIGAPLAIDYALDALAGDAKPTPASLVLVSPAIGVSRAAALAAWQARLAVLPGLEKLAWVSIQPAFDPYKYNSFATNSGAQAHAVISAVAGRIKALSKADAARFPPTLVLKSTVDATVTTGAVVERLLKPLAPSRNELVLFDINRFVIKSSILIDDPGPLTRQVMTNANLPFAVTLVTNENPESRAVVARRKPPFTAEASDTDPLNLAWPPGVVSLSHVALPFPLDDPLYGLQPRRIPGTIYLGASPLKGERGLLKIPDDWLLRLRSNPFYAYLQARAVAWVDAAAGR